MLYILTKLLCCILLTKVLVFKQAGGYRTLVLSIYKMSYIPIKLTPT
jgi:hypothetical protein